MNAGYLIYQAERTRTAAEQREVDAARAELAASLARLWHSLAAPLRFLRRNWRGAWNPGLMPGCGRNTTTRSGLFKIFFPNERGACPYLVRCGADLTG